MSKMIKFCFIVVFLLLVASVAINIYQATRKTDCETTIPYKKEIIEESYRDLNISSQKILTNVNKLTNIDNEGELFLLQINDELYLVRVTYLEDGTINHVDVEDRLL